MLELWVDEPPEIRLPSHKGKTTYEKGGGDGTQNIPTRKITQIIQKNKAKRERRIKKMEEKEETKGA